MYSSLEKRNLIILGGSGFFGQQFVAIGREKYNLAVVDAATPSLPFPDVPVVQGDLSNDEGAYHAIESARGKLPERRVDALINLAAKVSYLSSHDELYAANVKTARNSALNAARLNAVFLHMGAIASQGHVQGLITEEHPLAAVEPYGETKAEAERELHQLANGTKFCHLVFRSTVPIGPGLERSINNAIFETALGPIVPYRGTKSTYVATEDIARAFFFAFENYDALAKPAKTIADRAYNVGTAEGIADKEMFLHLAKMIQGPEAQRLTIPTPYVMALAAGWVTEQFYRTAKALGIDLPPPPLVTGIAKLTKTGHEQDQSKFEHDFGRLGFKLKYKSGKDVLNLGLVHKLNADWHGRIEPTIAIRRFARRHHLKLRN
ncbi:MAG TPA: NAD(P)-dependent oxidoreductase [Candidatus Nanoarchaeia archaeon]|nr:NAD(P)-dependent oxidoreductase [Candidatus Nanoarchaeia archaeon]